MRFHLGTTLHTFSLVAQCERTGMLGIAIATRAMAVGSRCPVVQAGVGAIATQASTDPRLGVLGLRLLEQGYPAHRVLQELEATDPYIEHRQLGIVDRYGNAAARTGSRNHPWAGHLVRRGYVALGNYLLGEHILTAMAGAFEASAGESLEERLMRALEAARDAGGQHGGQRSAGLLVYDREPFPRVDLRVDDHDEPIGELRRLLVSYRPLIDYYHTQRPADPTIPPPEA